jgi:hypothetical protein
MDELREYIRFVAAAHIVQEAGGWPLAIGCWQKQSNLP